MDFPDAHNTNFLNMQFHSEFEESVPPKKRRLGGDGISSILKICDFSLQGKAIHSVVICQEAQKGFSILGLVRNYVYSLDL